MSFALMGLIDLFVGRPLLWVLRLFYTGRGKTLGGDRYLKSPPKSVLIFKCVGGGSIVLSFPLLARLKQNGVRVTFVTFQSNAALLRMSGLVDQIETIHTSLFSFPLSLFKLIYKIRSLKFGAVVDLEPTANLTSILSAISGVSYRVGFLCGLPSREALFTHLIAITASRHLSHHYAMVAPLLGIFNRVEPSEIALPNFRLPKSSPRLDFLENGSKKVVINISCSELLGKIRRWPHSSWLALCQALLKSYDHSGEITLIFTGMKADWQEIENIRSELAHPERTYNLAGWTTLEELLEILNRADLVVTTDSGPAHMAAWTKAPTVCLFGPETPTLFAPLSKNSQVISRNLHCSPCGTLATGKKSKCQDNQCMKQIAVSEVLSSCLKKLEHPSSPRMSTPKTAA